MPFSNLLPGFPNSPLDLIITVVGFMGALTLAYGVFLESEERQDGAFVVAAASLFVYALSIHSKIFMLAMGLMLLASGHEIIQIVRGKHVHSAKTIKIMEEENKVQ